MDSTAAHNPADVPLVTLDTNALIAVREQEPDAAAVHELLEMNRAGLLTINITLSTALEAGRGGKRLEWQEHIAWLESLGIAKGHIFTGPRTVGFRTPDAPDAITFGVEYELALNERVHLILRPSIPYRWYDYRNAECERAGVPVQAMAEYDFAQMHFYIPPTPQHPKNPPTPHYDALNPEDQACLRDLYTKLHRKWHNAKNDALGFYNHVTVAAHTTHPEWAVFVTRDAHFLAPTKLTALRALGYLGQILPPAQALAFLQAYVEMPSIPPISEETA